MTSQGGNYSVLLVRSIEPPRLVLEEITVPQSAPKPDHWKEWVSKRAPSHTAWVAYVFDLDKNTIQQCYSYSQRQWLFIEKTDNFLLQLLILPLRETKENELKRIGPAPQSGESDRRKIWYPQLIWEGKKNEKPHFEVVRAKWPEDSSRLSGCVIELYLDSQSPFPFPYWLEVQSSHYNFKMQSVDSGTQMISPMTPLR